MNGQMKYNFTWMFCRTFMCLSKHASHLNRKQNPQTLKTDNTDFNCISQQHVYE